MNYGEKIIELRKKNNLTQAELGEKLSVTPQAVSKWENGLAEPDIDTVKKMCEVFGVTANEFIGVDGDEKTEPVEQKIISGYCERCKKPLYVGEYKIKSTTVSHRVGRNHTNVTTQHIYCDDCYNKIEKEEAEARERQRKMAAAVAKSENARELRRGLIWGAVGGIIALIFSVIAWVNLDPLTGGYIALGVFLTFGTFALISQCCWEGSVLSCLLFFVRTFRMPGIIFALDIDGIIKLILIKVAFAILAWILSTLVFIFGFLFTAAYACLAFPFALVKKIKGDL